MNSRPEWSVSKSVRLSGRYRVEITIGPGGMVCEWSPKAPEPKSLTAEVRRYRGARDELVAQVAARMGGRALVVEAGDELRRRAAPRCGRAARWLKAGGGRVENSRCGARNRPGASVLDAAEPDARFYYSEKAALLT